jgi:hypothetical protein
VNDDKEFSTWISFYGAKTVKKLSEGSGHPEIKDRPSNWQQVYPPLITWLRTFKQLGDPEDLAASRALPYRPIVEDHFYVACFKCHSEKGPGMEFPWPENEFYPWLARENARIYHKLQSGHPAKNDQFKEWEATLPDVLTFLRNYPAPPGEGPVEAYVRKTRNCILDRTFCE